MKVMGLVGWSGSGKTTLLEKLLPVLVARGLRVSTMKHAHHHFDVDLPGKDSWRHRQAGAVEVMVSSAGRWALMHELRDEPEPDVDALVARMTPVDLLLIEGFKRHGHHKIEVWRAGASGEPWWRSDPRVIAVASDGSMPAAERAAIPVPVLDLDDPDAIAAFIVARCGLAPLQPAAGRPISGAGPGAGR